jgi:hypothetical protein
MIRTWSFSLFGSAMLGLSSTSSTIAQSPKASVATSLASAFDSASAWRATSSPPSACMAAIPASAMDEQLVFLDARLPAKTSALIRIQANMMAKDVSAELRAILGGSEYAVPSAASRTHWYSVPAELIVIARKDGRESWRGVSRSGDLSAVALLSSAMDSARAHGAAMIVWPDGFTADSLVVRLTLLPVDFEELPTPDSSSATRVTFASFTVPSPHREPARAKEGQQPLVYPKFSERNRVIGTVIEQFVVDTTGRADPSTFHDLWPSDKPRLEGARAAYYNAFVDAIKGWAANAEFTPAHVGPCLVRELVEIPIRFMPLDSERASRQ